MKNVSSHQNVEHFPSISHLTLEYLKKIKIHIGIPEKDSLKCLVSEYVYLS